MNKKILICFYFILSAFVFSGCGIYSFTGASINPEAKTVAIKHFQNFAPIQQPTLSQSFTETLQNKFSQQTNLNLIDKNADYNIEGSITGYSVSPIAIQGNQTAALNRLTITVSVKFTNKFDEKQNFDAAFSRYADFESTKALAAVESELIKQINEALVDDIFNRAMVNW